MRRRAFMVGIASGIAATLAVTLWIIPLIAGRRSDVPVRYEIAAWPYQAGLCVDQVQATVVDGSLGLFDQRAAVQFRIVGSISGSQAWRPSINAVQMSQRVVGIATTNPTGDIQLIPIVGVTSDPNYDGSPVPFDVTIEQPISSLQWGRNEYIAAASDKTVEFILHQPK